MAKSKCAVGSSTFQKIKRDIIFGNLAPATKLELSDLRTRYGAGISTLRETLNHLASEGFVAAEEQSGFIVTGVSREDLIEIAEPRVLLECHALRLSIKNGDTNREGNPVAAHHKLHRIEQRMQDGTGPDREDWRRYDWEFHLAMIAACSP